MAPLRPPTSAMERLKAAKAAKEAVAPAATPSSAMERLKAAKAAKAAAQSAALPPAPIPTIAPPAASSSAMDKLKAAKAVRAKGSPPLIPTKGKTVVAPAATAAASAAKEATRVAALPLDRVSPPPGKPVKIDSRLEAGTQNIVTAAVAGARLAVQAGAAAEARADAEAAAEADFADIKGLLFEALAGQTAVIGAVERVEGMAITAGPARAKQLKVAGESVARLEGMAMSSSSHIAKLASKQGLDQEIAEAMLMQAAMNASKFEKTTNGRTGRIESMLMSQAHSVSKLVAAAASRRPAAAPAATPARTRAMTSTSPNPSRRQSPKSITAADLLVRHRAKEQVATDVDADMTASRPSRPRAASPAAPPRISRVASPPPPPIRPSAPPPLSAPGRGANLMIDDMAERMVALEGLVASLQTKVDDHLDGHAASRLELVEIDGRLRRAQIAAAAAADRAVAADAKIVLLEDQVCPALSINFHFLSSSSSLWWADAFRPTGGGL